MEFTKGSIMGFFAIATDDDNVRSCLSAVKVNIKMYEESMGGEYEEKSEYLLTLAQSALEKAVLVHKRKHETQF